MRRMSALALMLVFAITGCDAERVAPQSTSSDTAETGISSSDPAAPADDTGVAAESVAPPAEPSVGEALFLEAVGTAWRGDLPDAGELVRLGQAACGDIRRGAALVDVEVIEGTGEARDRNNDDLRLAALHLLCPELVQS